MLVIAGYVRIAASQRERALAAAIEMMRETLKEPGCTSYAFTADLVDPNVFRIFEEWESSEALEAHFATTHMKTFQAAIASLKVEALDVKRYEVSRVGPVR